jgi:hypothetical protein
VSRSQGKRGGGIGGGDTKTGLIRDSYRCGSVCGRYPIPDAPSFLNFFFIVAVLDQGEKRFSFRRFLPLDLGGTSGVMFPSTFSAPHEMCDAGDVTQGAPLAKACFHPSHTVGISATTACPPAVASPQPLFTYGMVRYGIVYV